jgi:hypothetical protein
MPDQLAEFQKDVSDVQHSLEAVSKAQADQAKAIAALEEKAGGEDAVKRSEIADLKAQQDTIVRQTTATADKVDQMNTRGERLSQDVQAPWPCGVSMTPAPLGADARRGGGGAAGSRHGGGCRSGRRRFD